MPTMFIQVEHFYIVYINKKLALKIFNFFSHENKVLEVGHRRSTYNPSTGEVEAG